MSFASAAGCRCANIADDEPVDFAIVGTGAGGGTLACRLAEAGFSVVGLRRRPVVAAARGFRLRRDAAAQALLDRRAHLRRRQSACSSAPTTAASRSAAARCISPWCRCASGRNGSSRAASSATASTGRSIGARCGATTREVEQALKISGPVNYPWGPKRPRYPYRPHELNAAALVLAKGAEALGIDWTPTPLATVSAPRGLVASLRLSRLLRHRLLDQRQAERADHLDSARGRRRRRDPRSRDGRAHRDRSADRPRHRRALSPRGPLALPAGAQRRRRRLCDRDAAAAAEFGEHALSRRARQQLRPGRQESDGAVQPGGLRHDGARRSAGTRGRRRSRSPSTGTTTITARISSAAIAL